MQALNYMYTENKDLFEWHTELGDWKAPAQIKVVKPSNRVIKQEIDHYNEINVTGNVAQNNEDEDEWYLQHYLSKSQSNNDQNEKKIDQ